MAIELTQLVVTKKNIDNLLSPIIKDNIAGIKKNVKFCGAI